MKRSVVNCFVYTLCLVLVFLVLETSSKQCGDPECKSVIATGRAVLRYRGGGEGKVNLDANDAVEILAKDVGKEGNYLVRTGKGKVGFAGKQFIRESSILIKSIDRVTIPDDIAATDIKPTQPVVLSDNIAQSTIVEGTVLANEVLLDSTTPVATATEAPSSVTPTPTLEMVPTTQTAESKPSNGADSLKPEAHYGDEEEPDRDSEEDAFNEVDDDEEEEEEEEDASEEEGDEELESSNEQSPSGTEAAIDTTGPDGEPDSDNVAEQVHSKPAVDLSSKPSSGLEGITNDKQELLQKPEESTPTIENKMLQPETDKAAEQVLTETAEDLNPKPSSGVEGITIDGQDGLQKPEESTSTIENQLPTTAEQGDSLENEIGADELVEKVTDSSSGASTHAEVAMDSIEQGANETYDENTIGTDNSKETVPENQKDTVVGNPTVVENVISGDSSSKEPYVTEVSQDSTTTEPTWTVDETTTPMPIEEISATEAPAIFSSQEVVTETIAPVVAEPAPVTEIENDTPGVVELATKPDSVPTHPNRILAGGLGNLLAHNHHHHHHHHHHHPHHHHNHHDHDYHDHEHKVPDVNPTGAKMEPVGDTHLHFPAQTESIEQNTLLRHGDAVHVERHEETFGDNNLYTAEHVSQGPIESSNAVSEENGFCDSASSDCPPPAASLVPPSIQHSNGGGEFKHPLVSQQQPMGDVGRRNEGEIEQSQDASNEAEDFLGVGKQQRPIGDYIEAFVQEAIKLSDLILMLAITSFTLLVFSLGHYLINKNRREKPLIYKLNMIERDLMTSYKENTLLKSELQETKHKLTSIENNSFGSNDMVIALKGELDTAEQVKLELQDQIAGLEKELENAAEAGLELNKMVAELLNQNGSDSIALSVEELQRQLNEQQQTILSMNASLAEKSRENSELQIAIASQTGRFNERLEELEKERTELTERRKQLEEEVASLHSEQQVKVDGLRKETSTEIDRLMKELKTAQNKADESRKALAATEAKCEALEECLKEVKSDGGKAGKGMIDSIEWKAKIALLTKEKANMQDKLQGEIIARQLVEDHMKMVNEEISTLKREFSKAEKDKLEAETRLEVLSSYFKEKETQLQKELSVKEAMWMQQQGETTSTVEKIRHMQDETQQLKSQNDKLRAEIEAQATAHKAQYTTLETRSHDAWLTARQAERRLEEARSESSALRRKLTALGDISASSDGIVNLPNASITQTDLGLTAPSPIRVESPNAPPMMGVLPPPPFMPPFMPGPPPPFMPPFMPPPHGPGEMRPPPLGRLMSPPPPNNRYSPNSIIDARDRYSPDHRGRYSPDSRYDYSVMSTYETENDFSPPPSPPHHSRHSNYDRDHDRDRDRERDRERERERERERDRDRDRDRDRHHLDGRGSGNGGYSRGYTPTGMRTSPPIQDPRNKKYAGTNNSHYSDDEFDGCSY
uniref:SH3 domain-containing protein n=1 Tax=Anopheles dirus TaxID=7168 RepID=A0A182NE45_9DIPT